MPVYLRMWYINKLVETKKKENDAHERSMKKSNTPTIHRPRFEKPK